MRHILMMPLIIRFRFTRLSQRSKVETVFGDFQNPCFAHASFHLTLDMTTRWEIVQNETISTTLTSSVMSQRAFEYSPLYSFLREGSSGGNF